MKSRVVLFWVLLICFYGFPQTRYTKDFITPEVYKSKTNLHQLTKESSDSVYTFPSLKEDFMINALDGNAGAEQLWNNIGKNQFGEYLLSWIDERNGRRQLYAQFLIATELRLGIISV